MGLKIVRLDNAPSIPSGAPVMSADPSAPSLVGKLSAALVPKLLMEIFIGERSGKLIVNAMPGPSGTLFFVGGEPAHVAVDDGGAAIEKRLAARGILKPRTTDIPRHLNPLAHLSRRSHPVAVLEALREEVRDFARQLLSVQAGEFAFHDGEEFVDDTPLTAVNPFGFVLEARRRATPPEAMFRQAAEIGALYPIPVGGFANATSRLRAFTGQHDLADVVDGVRSAADVCAHAGLDPMMGALVLQTLVDTGLLQLSTERRPNMMRDRRKRSSATAKPALVQADAKQLSGLASLPGRGGAEILALYLEIKPERDDNAILGVEGSAGPSTVERCYQQRLAELDPRAIPASPNRPYLLARVEELRTKVERAYRTRTATHSRGGAAYEMLDKIGAGGMAEVYRGRPKDDPLTLVAIKCILPELRSDPQFSQMFLDEARLARRIAHPNVVRILTVGKSTDDLYLAMEYVDGVDFGELCRRARDPANFGGGGPPPIDVVLRIIAEACAGLHAAHTARDRFGNVTPILHRDVSPQNILVSRMGDVKLSDFGIAKAMDAQQHQEEERGVKGKIPYLAPELLLQQPASVRSDVYAMAMTIYAALAKLPFARGEQNATMKAIVYDPLPPLSQMVAGVHARVDHIVMRAAARSPDERHGSAQELQLEIEEYLASRPAVDVGAWARPLAGKQKSARDSGLIPRPITSTTQSRPTTISRQKTDVGSPPVAGSSSAAQILLPQTEEIELDDL